MSLREQAWWSDFCLRLKTEPLDNLARFYRQSPQALAVALALGDSGGPVTEMPWWPDAVRRYKNGASLREISRLYGANLRRLRRGLARVGLRVAGSDLSGEGVPALLPYRDVLGREPDRKIATLARVPVEAVQGERRRLGIAPYSNSKTVAAPTPAPAPAPAPPPPARAAARPASEPIQTPIRRVVLTASSPTTPTPPARGAAPPPEEPRFPGRGWQPDTAGRGATVTRPGRRDASGAEPQVVRRPTPGTRLGSGAPGDVPPTEDRAWRRESSESGLDDLSTPGMAARERRGRLRIIRPDAITAEPLPEPETPRPRKRREPSYSPVRVLSVDDLDPAELSPAPQAPRPEPEPRAEEPVIHARPAPVLDDLPPEADEVTADVPPLLDEVEAGALPEHAEEADLALVAEEAEVAAPEATPRASRARRAPRPRPVAAPPAPPAVAEAPPQLPAVLPPAAPVERPSPALSPRTRGWLVEVAGRAAPLVVLAEDVISAAQRAALELTPGELGSASISAFEIL